MIPSPKIPYSSPARDSTELNSQAGSPCCRLLGAPSGNHLYFWSNKIKENFVVIFKAFIDKLFKFLCWQRKAYCLERKWSWALHFLKGQPAEWGELSPRQGFTFLLHFNWICTISSKCLLRATKIISTLVCFGGYIYTYTSPNKLLMLIITNKRKSYHVEFSLLNAHSSLLLELNSPCYYSK